MRLEDFPEEVREHIRDIACAYTEYSDEEAYEKLNLTLPELIGIIRKHLVAPIEVGDHVALRGSRFWKDCTVVHIDGNLAWVRDYNADNTVFKLENLEKVEVG